jgi:hypothetical protein
VSDKTGASLARLNQKAGFPRPSPELPVGPASATLHSADAGKKGRIKNAEERESFAFIRVHLRLPPPWFSMREGRKKAALHLLKSKKSVDDSLVPAERRAKFHPWLLLVTIAT